MYSLYYFKEVIVFIDISDIQDEVYYHLNSDDIVSNFKPSTTSFAKKYPKSHQTLVSPT